MAGGDDMTSLLDQADHVDGATVDQGQPQPGGEVIEKAAPGYQPDKETIAALSVVIQMGGNGLASFYDSDHWKVDNNEAEVIAVPLDVVLTKYLGSGYNLPPEVTLLLALGGVFLPKYQQQMAMANGKESEPTKE